MNLKNIDLIACTKKTALASFIVASFYHGAPIVYQHDRAQFLAYCSELNKKETAERTAQAMKELAETKIMALPVSNTNAMPATIDLAVLK